MATRGEPGRKDLPRDVRVRRSSLPFPSLGHSHKTRVTRFLFMLQPFFGIGSSDRSSSGEKQCLSPVALPPVNDPPRAHHRESMGLVGACGRSSSSVAANDKGQTDRGERQSQGNCQRKLHEGDQRTLREREVITAKHCVWILGSS